MKELMTTDYCNAMVHDTALPMWSDVWGVQGWVDDEKMGGNGCKGGWMIQRWVGAGARVGNDSKMGGCMRVQWGCVKGDWGRVSKSSDCHWRRSKVAAGVALAAWLHVTSSRQTSNNHTSICVHGRQVQ